MTKKERTSTTTRRPYEKPQLQEVRLVPEEAVLQTCKRGGQTGPGAKNCDKGPVPCVQKFHS